LYGQTIALIFNKRSTRTRVASETATKLLGGHPMFLGGQDIQLGVNETLADSAKVISSMADGFMARVGAHEEIEELAQHSRVPVVNALSDLYHPTQILADLLTLFEHYSGYLKGKKIAWVGDTNNISNELLVTLPRFGAEFAIASPKGYDKVDPRVWAKVEEAQTQSLVTLTNSPAEALKDADVVVTDTWISMGQEEEKAARLKAFSGYQITNEMVNEAGAKDSWVFLHCLPRKQEEVNDEVFYGDRSLVFPEAENRKWTILSVF
ncbi:OTC protein, partial [Spelaeornis formosus]|nr:OTC protein [Elachura formosa]